MIVKYKDKGVVKNLLNIHLFIVFSILFSIVNFNI